MENEERGQEYLRLNMNEVVVLREMLSVGCGVFKNFDSNDWTMGGTSHSGASDDECKLLRKIFNGETNEPRQA